MWNTNAPHTSPGEEAFAYEDFSPGHTHVDVLAADGYRKDYRQSHHDDLLQLARGKPIALGEIGQFPDVTVLDQQPAGEWFMSWGNLLTRLNDSAPIQVIYDHPRTLTLDNVRPDDHGRYRVQM